MLSKDQLRVLRMYPADGSERTSSIDRSGGGAWKADARRALVRKGLLEGGTYRRRFKLTTAGRQMREAMKDED